MNVNDSLLKANKSSLAIGLLISLAHVAFGQTAAISGAVKDQSGGAISGVQITATANGHGSKAFHYHR